MQLSGTPAPVRPLVVLEAPNRLLESEWRRLGAQLIVSNASDHSRADVLWRGAQPISRLQPQQNCLISGIHGMSLLTRKESLIEAARHSGWEFVPCALHHEGKLECSMGDVLDRRLPQESFSWVAKGRTHRHVRVLPKLPSGPEELAELLNLSLVQRRVADPWLIGGRAFDVGVYVLVSERKATEAGTPDAGTSEAREKGRPDLEFQLFDDVLLRFCAAPFSRREEAEELMVRDPAALGSLQRGWVVSDNYVSAWELPALQPALGQAGGHCRTALSSVLGGASEARRLWGRLEAVVARTLRAVHAVGSAKPGAVAGGRGLRAVAVVAGEVGEAAVGASGG